MGGEHYEHIWKDDSSFAFLSECILEELYKRLCYKSEKEFISRDENSLYNKGEIIKIGFLDGTKNKNWKAKSNTLYTGAYLTLHYSSFVSAIRTF